MLLKEKLENIRKNEISKLVIDGKIIGLRIKLFNVNLDTFEYYDFTLQTVAVSEEVKSYINSLAKSMNCIELYAYNNSYASKDEISGKIRVKEFKDSQSAIMVLGQFKAIHEQLNV